MAPSPLARAISTPDLVQPESRSPPSKPEASSLSSRALSGDSAQPSTSGRQGYVEPSATEAAPQRMTRRALRKLGRTWTLEEVRQHRRKDDAWIAVDGRVYDITEHLLHHPGWKDAGSITTPLSILAHAGTECSEEFREIHRPYPVAWRQLAAFYIGDLAPEESLAAGRSA
ncbi:hypothetical protein HYH03_004936 [Edaphochlamys debaryana]|uniref:Cytochrome b5 heme-binding domain-containing protein n=1 Tax=Edaphochlamys debaryana TaxID=47281 RepID=A0A836C1N0_9CHLO|nr:hypothetical protein HYH03_004936 [Edaphochlamys debaryana]|eukprot:KAG2496930.1 hypothetical protein HYH03_004936 [Edaphochlamys debaryana]